MNDNLLFSCCCARIDWSWTTVCGCYRGGSKCDLDCLEKALVHDSLFYPIGTVSAWFPIHVSQLHAHLEIELIQQPNLHVVRARSHISPLPSADPIRSPESTVWLIGHSLGGALASLLGATFGNPVVTFESPGERLASTRLHLPQPVRPRLSLYSLTYTSYSWNLSSSSPPRLRSNLEPRTKPIIRFSDLTLNSTRFECDPNIELEGSAAFAPSRYPCIPYRRSYRYGYVQRCSLVLRPGRICARNWVSSAVPTIPSTSIPLLFLLVPAPSYSPQSPTRIYNQERTNER